MILRHPARAALLAGSLLALGACSETMTADAGGAQAATSAPTASAPSASSNTTAADLVGSMPTDMRGFVEMAASSDMFEIQSSEFAKSKGIGGELAAFADQMIRDHTRTSSEMKALLASMSPPMAPPTEMTGKHRAMLAQLREASGAGLGSTYVDLQRASHNEAVALFTAYSQNGDNPALRQFAAKNLPALQGHLEHIRGIESKM
jgi:putative membrane protein